MNSKIRIILILFGITLSLLQLLFVFFGFNWSIFLREDTTFNTIIIFILAASAIVSMAPYFKNIVKENVKLIELVLAVIGNSIIFLAIIYVVRSLQIAEKESITYGAEIFVLALLPLGNLAIAIILRRSPR